MIGKIYTFKYGIDVYVRITGIYSHNTVCGKVIKSNLNYMYYVGYEYDLYAPTLKEISEEEFNKIMVFE